MMPIDLTAQLAPVLDGMILLLVVATAALAVDALRGVRQKPSVRREWSAAAKPVRA